MPETKHKPVVKRRGRPKPSDERDTRRVSWRRASARAVLNVIKHKE